MQNELYNLLGTLAFEHTGLYTSARDAAIDLYYQDGANNLDRNPEPYEYHAVSPEEYTHKQVKDILLDYRERCIYHNPTLWRGSTANHATALLLADVVTALHLMQPVNTVKEPQITANSLLQRNVTRP